jgi:hypothetical protein
MSHVVPPRRRACASYTPHCRNIDVAVQKHRNSRNTSHDSAMCMPAHGRSMAPRTVTHTSCSHTHGQWLSHTSCLSVLFISIHRDATSLRLSASSDRKSASSHMLRCCLRWTDRSAAALRTCLPFSAPAESCERVPATVVLQPFAACRSSHMLPAEYPSVPLPHVLVGPPGSPLIACHMHFATASTTVWPPPARRRLLAAAAACTPPARRLHAACAAFGRVPLTRA